MATAVLGVNLGDGDGHLFLFFNMSGEIMMCRPYIHKPFFFKKNFSFIEINTYILWTFKHLDIDSALAYSKYVESRQRTPTSAAAAVASMGVRA